MHRQHENMSSSQADTLPRAGFLVKVNYEEWENAFLGLYLGQGWARCCLQYSCNNHVEMEVVDFNQQQSVGSEGASSLRFYYHV